MASVKSATALSSLALGSPGVAARRCTESASFGSSRMASVKSAMALSYSLVEPGLAAVVVGVGLSSGRAGSASE